jgi:hypothetical protein
MGLRLAEVSPGYLGALPGNRRINEYFRGRQRTLPEAAGPGKAEKEEAHLFPLVLLTLKGAASAIS